MDVATLTSWKSGVSPERMREIDRATEKDYGINPLLLMEGAGLATARVARSFIGSPLSGRRVCILAGPGNNGGDGLVAARRLAGWDATVTVITSYAGDGARGMSRNQLEVAARAGVEIVEWRGQIPPNEMTVDALLGFGATGAPRGAVREMIVAANEGQVPILALDVPSGIDAGSGAVLGDCIIAGATVTLALAKTGLLAPAARPFVGKLLLADIGVPPALLRELGIDAEGLFAADDIVELDLATGDIRRD
jgi:hydroxyethylthiazole kinase-like uncharacterized protein yjeF